MSPTWNAEAAEAIIARLKTLDGAALPILHALQEAFGYVDRAAVPLIAEALNLSRAEVHGILTFYHDFRTEPPSGRVIKLCRAEACQAQGCESLAAEAEAQLGVAVDGGPGKGGVAIETVYCLGNCALGPAALVEGALIGRLDSPMLKALCDGAAVAEIIGVREDVA